MTEVVFVCPDRHIVYDGRTPGEVGVGGGITVRIRMAQALKRLGYKVTAVVNCPMEATYQGVHYLPLDAAPRLSADLLVVQSSGGAYSLDCLDWSRFDTRMRVYWMAGVQPPAGFDAADFDSVYSPSNFLRRSAISCWSVEQEKVFVAYNGFEESFFSETAHEALSRDPFRLVYLSHPSKGMDPALEILRQLRLADERFNLHIYGGDALWGQEETRVYSGPGVVFHGLVGQRRLARDLFLASFSLCLQDREEPFGMVVPESQRAGCVVLASAVGAYPELVENGVNGFLINGPSRSEQVISNAVEKILYLSEHSKTRDQIIQRAQRVPWNSDLIARVWTQHWDRWFGAYEGTVIERDDAVCRECGSPSVQMDDGFHCFSCGLFDHTL